MIDLYPSPSWHLRYPPTSQALFAIAAWPVLLALGCWQMPQISEFLTSHGTPVDMWQVFHAGFWAYVLLLPNHRRFNRRHFERNAGGIALHHRLTKVEREMAARGLTQADEYLAVIRARAQLRKRLGFLIDADNFYRKLDFLVEVFRWLCRKLK